MHAILSAQGAPKFRKFCNSFAGFSQSICAIMTPRACFFRSARTVDPSESLSENIWVAQLMLAENNDFCAHGAPKFRKFCNSFAKFLRNFYMISTSDAHFFRSEQIIDFTESCSDVTEVVQRTLAKRTQLFLRKARRNSGNFAIRSRDFRTKSA